MWCEQPLGFGLLMTLTYSPYPVCAGSALSVGGEAEARFPICSLIVSPPC